MTPVSVVIPIHNGRDVIGPCLDSLLFDHDSQAIEIIVVDDCSYDGGGELVESSYPGVVLLTNRSNLGYAASINRGLGRCSGDHIMLLNQDTIVHPGAIDVLVRELETDARLAAVAPQLLNPDGSIQRSCRRLPEYADVIYHHLMLSYVFPQSRLFSRWKMAGFAHNHREEVEQPSFSAVLLRSEVVMTLGPLDERFRMFFNDVDYCTRILDRGLKILFCPDAKVTHEGGHAVKRSPVMRIVHSHIGFAKYFFKYRRGVIYILPNLAVTLLLAISAVPRIMYNVVAEKLSSSRSSR